MRLELKTPLPGPEAQGEMAPAYRKPSLARGVPPGAKEAAVLALLFPGERGGNAMEPLDWSVLLIRRNTYPGVHSGQISFPGGKREATDADLPETARRETREEVGVTPDRMDWVGALTPIYIPPSNFAVFPYLAVARPGTRLTPDPREVVEYRRVPLRALDPALAEPLEFADGGRTRPAPAWRYDGFTIWGATAMMLAELYRAADRGVLVAGTSRRRAGLLPGTRRQA